MPTTPPPVLQVSVETPLSQTTSVGLPEVRHAAMPVSPSVQQPTPNSASWLGSALALWQRHPEHHTQGHPQGDPIPSDNLGMNSAIPGH